jgi:uncharacterized protein
MDPMIQKLLEPEAYPHPVHEVRLLETHISWVILTGEYAYKIKKPVNLGFVDFTTFERRLHFCEEELRLNRRLAPELYLGLCPIYGPRNQATFQGTGKPIDYAVQMRQFDQSALLTTVLERGDLRSAQIDQFAAAVARFHAATRQTSAISESGTPTVIEAEAIENLDVLAKIAEFTETVRQLREWTNGEFLRLRAWLHHRHDAGFVRECHGDLHLGNLVLLEDRICAFDCLEFNPALRWTDVIAEIAFLVMDLQERGRPDLARRFLNRWLEETGDYDGLTGWRWYLIYRALVRAKVAVLRLQQLEIESAERQRIHQLAGEYLQLAMTWINPSKPVVIAMHGLSGSGKSVVSEWICRQFRALGVRSDVERKRLFGQWGVGSKSKLAGDMYSSPVTEKVYREILAPHVRCILNAGFAAVVDAANLHQWQRQLFREVAQQRGLEFLIVDVRATSATLRQRLIQRQVDATDPSDADVSVLELQLSSREPLDEHERAASVVVDSESDSWQSDLAEMLHSRLVR